jgi:tRNA nucleotidyltransferase (CCA-adding enzyme)
MLTGRSATDLDFLVLDATAEEFQQRFPGARQVGKAFPVFIMDGHEYAFPRSACAPCCGSGPGAQAQAQLMADLDARDFTINALALPLPDYPRIPAPGTALSMVIGHPRAARDLREHTIRPASARAIQDDPLRIFRAARFAAQLPHFTLHEETLTAMREAAASPDFAALAAPRIAQEVRKALRSPAPGNFLRALHSGGALGVWFQEFLSAPGIPAGPLPWHDEDVLEHTAQALDRLAGDEDFPPAPADREVAAWMTLCHDLGKTMTPADKHPSHHGHDDLGEPPALRLGERLALPTRFIRAGGLSARLHMTAGRYAELRPGTRVDLLTAAHAQQLTSELFAVVKADKHHDHGPTARRDLDSILAVHLEDKDQDNGPASGDKLRMLRSEALARVMRQGGEEKSARTPPKDD